MKKIIDKRVLTVLSVIFILGVIGGMLLLILTNKLDKLIIKNGIEEYFKVIKNKDIISFSNIFNSFKNNLTFIIIIFITNIVFILSPLSLFINFYKGLQIGFLMSSIVLTYKLKGIFLSILILIPHHIIMSLLIIIYTNIMFNYSKKLYKAFKNKENINIRLFTEKVFILFICSLLICLISSLLEIYLSSFLLRVVV